MGCATKQLLEHFGWAGRSWVPAMMAERTGSRFDSGLLKLWMVRGPSQLCAKVWSRQVLSSTCNWIEMEVHSGQQLLPAQETNEIIPCGSQK